MPYKDPEKQREARRRSYLKLKGLPTSWVTKVAERAKKITDNNRKRVHYATPAEREIGRKEASQRASKNRGLVNKNFFQELKKTLACELCGFNHPWTLEFHHRDPLTKEGNLAKNVYKWSQARIQREIAKCQVLCANCHRIVHYELRQQAQQKISS